MILYKNPSIYRKIKTNIPEQKNWRATPDVPKISKLVVHDLSKDLTDEDQEYIPPSISRKRRTNARLKKVQINSMKERNLKKTKYILDTKIKPQKQFIHQVSYRYQDEQPSGEIDQLKRIEDPYKALQEKERNDSDISDEPSNLSPSAAQFEPKSKTDALPKNQQPKVTLTNNQHSKVNVQDNARTLTEPIPKTLSTSEK